MENKKTADHYEMTYEFWRKRFLSMDHDELIQRFKLKKDDQALYTRFIVKNTGLTEETAACRMWKNQSVSFLLMNVCRY